MLYPMARSSKFVQSLNLFNLEKLYGHRKSIEVATIDRILCDEDRHLSLKDLPSFYASANGLLKQMKNQLGQEDLQDKMLNEAYEFGNNVEINSDQVELLLDNLTKQSGKTDHAEKSIKALVGCILKLNCQNTLDIIESMIVLPFEHQRLQKVKNLEY